MIIYGAWLYHDLATYIGTDKPRKDFEANTGEIFSVNMSSNRLECFRRSPVCVGCGVIGVIFLLNAGERKKCERESPHQSVWVGG